MNIILVTTAKNLPPEPLGDQTKELRVRCIALPGADLAELDTHFVHMPQSGAARVGNRISSALQGNAVLRMILRISPLDAGARFWRALRRDKQVSSFLDGTDLLVAVDRDTNLACWQLARRTGFPAVSGLAAARQEISRRNMR